MQSETLRFLRTAQNLKQKTVADILEMSQPNYSNLENGKTRLNNSIAEKLAGYYGVNKEVFLTARQSLIQHTISEHGKSIYDSAQYFETNKELLDPILDRMEILLNLLADEKEELAFERKQLSDVLEKIMSRFGHII
jgi:transcriptional regulator with XRE-family HTH domain